jgi:hypothetical protein
MRYQGSWAPNTDLNRWLRAPGSGEAPRHLVALCTSRTVNSERVRYVFFAFTTMRHTHWQSLAQDVPCDETRAIADIKFFGITISPSSAKITPLFLIPNTISKLTPASGRTLTTSASRGCQIHFGQTPKGMRRSGIGRSRSEE